MKFKVGDRVKIIDSFLLASLSANKAYISKSVCIILKKVPGYPRLYKVKCPDGATCTLSDCRLQLVKIHEQLMLFEL